MKKLIVFILIYLFSVNLFSQISETTLKLGLGLGCERMDVVNIDGIKGNLYSTKVTGHIGNFILEVGGGLETFSNKVENTTYSYTYNGKYVYTGPEGGHYYFNNKGNKEYVDLNSCKSTLENTKSYADLQYSNISFGIGYKFDTNYVITLDNLEIGSYFGPYIGYDIIKSTVEGISVDELKNEQNKDSYLHNVVSDKNFTKSEFQIGLVFGLYTDSFGIQAKITQKSSALYVIMPLSL